MNTRMIAAILAVAAALGAGASLAGDRDRDRDRGGWGGGHHGMMLDFDAVAGPGAEALDRGQLEAWGVQQLGALDTDGNGVFDRNELAAAMPPMPRNPLMVFTPDPTEARVTGVLRMFEAEAAGEVSVEALVGRQADRLFRRLDRNDDGRISRAEAEEGPRGRDRGRRSRD